MYDYITKSFFLSLRSNIQIEKSFLLTYDEKLLYIFDLETLKIIKILSINNIEHIKYLSHYKDASYGLHVDQNKRKRLTYDSMFFFLFIETISCICIRII